MMFRETGVDVVRILVDRRTAPAERKPNLAGWPTWCPKCRRRYGAARQYCDHCATPVEPAPADSLESEEIPGPCERCGHNHWRDAPGKPLWEACVYCYNERPGPMIHPDARQDDGDDG